MSSDAMDQGRFQGMILERLDSIRVMAYEVKECLKEHDKRITSLEHTKTKVSAWATVAGLVAGFIGSKIPLFPVSKSALYGTAMGSMVLWLWPLKTINGPKSGSKAPAA